MARVESFTRPTMRVDSQRDHNGRFYIAWKPDVSMWFNERKALLRWLNWPAKTPTGDALRAWLNELESSDQEHQQLKSDGLTQEQLATGFGPEVFLDEADPNFQTRTII
jgi:hypothetical protein